MDVIRRVGAYLFRYKGLFTLTLGLAVGSTLFGLAVPLGVKNVFETIQLANTDGSDIVSIALLGAALIGGLYLLREVFNSLRIRVNNTLEQKVLVDLRGDLHAKLLDLPVSFYDRRKSGEIASRVIDDVQGVERALLDGTEQGSVAILTVIGVTAGLFYLHPMLALLVMLPLPIVLVMARIHSRATRKNWKRVRESSGLLNSLLVEDIQGNRLIHSFALKDKEKGRFSEIAEKLRKDTLRAMFRWSLHGPGSNFVTSLGLVAVVGLGGWLLATDDGFGYPELLAFFLYAQMLQAPISQLNGLNHLLSQGRACGERVFEVLDHPVAIQNPERPQPFPSGSPHVRYDNVCFSYGEDRAQVLYDIDLELPANQTTALVGHTGAGKSTIANLLLRYYDVTQGAVTIGGTDVREMDLTDLRSHIGYVAQDPFLFDGTVRDNLLLAKADATDEQMIHALDGARAWDFVQHLPKQMDTLIGEKGIRLSMGEKQRLTIARVILKNPPLVILDEATASVDTITEKLIQEALENLSQDRTMLIIAHRLSTVKKADQIVVLDHGKIIERGNHNELCHLGGHYAHLWEVQADLIPEGV